MRNTRRALIKKVGAIGSLAFTGSLSAASALDPVQEGKLQTRTGPNGVRCVVTGQTKSGKSVIVRQAPVPRNSDKARAVVPVEAWLSLRHVYGPSGHHRENRSSSHFR
jgi:hypothetical protein